MVSLLSLWLPIIVSAVIIFLASWLLPMIVGHHRHDLRQLPQEDAVLEALRAAQIPPGDYMAPHISSPAQMRDPGWLEKRRRGPIALLTLSAGGEPNMGKALAQWFIYVLLMALLSGYVASRTLTAGAPYLSVFRVVATAAFMGCALAQPTAVDLVATPMEHDDQAHDRWADLRAAGRRCIRLAVATPLAPVPRGSCAGADESDRL